MPSTGSNVQREEFKRLGVEGDWDHPYTTMSFPAEAQIARELMKFAANGTLYRGSKPVMWSVVEKTALAEAEVEYEDYTSDTVWVKFPVSRAALESGANEDDTALAYQSRELGRERRHLDDHAVDAAGQSRDQLLAEDRLQRVSHHRRARRQLGEDRRHVDPRRQARRRRLQAGAGRRLSKSCRTCQRRFWRGSSARIRSRARRLRLRRPSPRRRSRHRRRRHGLRAHRAGPRPRGL